MKKLDIILLALCALLTIPLVCSAAPTAIYFQFNFDDTAIGVTMPSGIRAVTTGDKNRVETVARPKGSGNCLLIAKGSAGEESESYADMSFATYFGQVDAVLQFSFYTADATANTLVTIRATDATFHEVLTINPGGSLTVGGETIGSYEVGRWHRVVAFFKAEGTLDIYLDTNPAKTGIAYTPWLDGKRADRLRFQIRKSSPLGSLCIDDLRMYPGSELLDDAAFENVDSTLLVTPEAVVAQELKQAVAMLTESNAAYAKGEKGTADHRPIQSDGVWYLPAAWTARGFGGTAVQSGDTSITISLGGKTAVYTADQTTAMVDGVAVALAHPPKRMDGCLMLPITEFSERLLTCSVHEESRYGVLVLDAAKQAFTDAQLKDIYDYLTYTRPDAAQILADFSAMQGVHPRIMATAETFSGIREGVKTDVTMKTWYASMTASAERMLGAAHTYYDLPDGLRLLNMSRQLLKRAYTLGMAWQLTGDSRYADYLWDELEAVCNFSDWNSARHFLDTAEMTCGVAIAYDWCYDYWTEEQRAFVETALMELGLTPGMHCYERDGGVNGGWISWTNNWNQVCNGGLTVGALALMDVEPEFCSRLIERAFLSMEHMLGEFAPDGAWSEGVGYWHYCVSYFVYQMSALDTALGKDYGYFNCAGVNQTAYFMTYAQSAQGAFNFHDAGGGIINAPEVFYFSDKLNDGALTRIRLNEMRDYAISGSALDLLWYRPGLAAQTVDLPLDRSFRDTEMATFRTAFGDPNALFAGIHGGDNNINHGNLDSGTFVLDALGVRWASELGSENYNLPGYFGNSSGTRWQYYRCNAQGQNVIALNPVTEPGQEPTGFTRIQEFVSEERGGYAILDMSAAYGDKVSNARRGMKLDHNRTQAVLQDELCLTEKKDLWWFMHTTAEIELAEDGKSAVLSKSGKQMYLSLDVSRADAVFEVYAAEPLPGSVNPEGQTDNAEYRKLTIHLTDAVGELAICVRFIPLSADVSLDELTENGAEPMIPMSQWTIESGELAAATGIRADGEGLAEFAPNVYTYIKSLPYGTKTAPVVTASVTSNMTAEITQAPAANGTAKILVYETENPDNRCYYMVRFSVRSATRSEFAEDFEDYKTMDDFQQQNVSGGAKRLWTVGQVLEKAGPHSLETGAGYDGTVSKYFRMYLSQDAEAGVDPALVTAAIDFTEPMELHFDVAAESLDDAISVVLREGSKPNWFYPFSKAAGSSAVQIFGTVISDFSMEANRWYHFDYQISFDPGSSLLSFSAWLNGEKVVEDGALLCAPGVSFESVIVKFAHTAGDMHSQAAAVNWDNILIRKKEYVAKHAAFYLNGREVKALPDLRAGDTVSFRLNAAYHGSDAVVLLLAQYAADGVRLKDLKRQYLNADELIGKPVSVELVLKDTPKRGESFRAFIWRDSGLVPLERSYALR